jgi:hypothetical protein
MTNMCYGQYVLWPHVLWPTCVEGFDELVEERDADVEKFWFGAGGMEGKPRGTTDIQEGLDVAIQAQTHTHVLRRQGRQRTRGGVGAGVMDEARWRLGPRWGRGGGLGLGETKG